ncbi:MAG TPA: NAD(P)H:quinone oxidoreductase [Tepidisphaeraceae bacterium]|jgi:NAD(P)H dehydrogenase (quinone)
MAKVQVIFYSMYGHLWKMAEAVAEGARQVPGSQVDVYQVAETLPQAVLEKMGAMDSKKAFAHIPVANIATLPAADAIIIGAPTRYGSACAQMQTFFDSTGQHWMSGALVGKVGSIFTSTATQHGGQETTLISMQTFLFHQGMVVVGVPYACQELMNMNEITGGSPYGASTMAGTRGERLPSANELSIARYQGKHITEIATKLTR